MRIGDKVKCINAYGTLNLSQGEVYEIKDIEIYDGSVYCKLKAQVGYNGLENPYSISRFELVPPDGKECVVYRVWADEGQGCISGKIFDVHDGLRQLEELQKKSSRNLKLIVQMERVYES